MDVDEAGRDDRAGRVQDDVAGGTLQVSDRDDRVSTQPDIRSPRRGTRPVDEIPSDDEDIETLIRATAQQSAECNDCDPPHHDILVEPARTRQSLCACATGATLEFVMDFSSTTRHWTGVAFAVSAMVTIASASVTSAQSLEADFRREVRDGNYSKAEALLSNPQLDPDARDGRGYTALMFAAENDRPELVTLLVKANVDLDIQNNDGETALIRAVRRGRVDGTRLLLMAGADVGITDASGRTAHDWAQERGRTYIAQIISIASRPSVARVILSEKPVMLGSESLEPPTVVEDTPPLYSENAFEQGIQGRVVLRVIIRKDGSMGPIRIHRSLDPDLDRAAVRAVSNWKFEPATIDGDPINVLADIEVDFEIDAGGPRQG